MIEEKNKDIMELIREEMARQHRHADEGGKVRALVVRPGWTPRMEQVCTSLASLRKLVGGPIEHAPLDGGEIVLVCCETGKVQGLPPNRALFRQGETRPYDVVAGTFLVMKEDLAREGYGDLSYEEANKYKELFWDPICRWGYRL